jgi:hypothetical protein
MDRTKSGVSDERTEFVRIAKGEGRPQTRGGLGIHVALEGVR